MEKDQKLSNSEHYNTYKENGNCQGISMDAMQSYTYVPHKKAYHRMETEFCTFLIMLSDESRWLVSWSKSLPASGGKQENELLKLNHSRL
jgi:hypothetical protein